MSNSLKLLVNSLAAFRITRLVTQDTITGKIRERLIEKFGEESPLSELIQCNWCTGVWVAGGVTVASRLFPKTWEKTATMLAYAAITGIIADKLIENARKVELLEQQVVESEKYTGKS
jgi:hypothetical protein